MPRSSVDTDEWLVSSLCAEERPTADSFVLQTPLILQDSCQDGKQPAFGAVLISLLRNGNEVQLESALDLHRWSPALLMRGLRAAHECQQLLCSGLDVLVDPGFVVHLNIPMMPNTLD